MPDLYPTHTCFTDAFELIEQVILQNPEDKEELKNELILVHAVCKMPDGTLYSHAWVEDTKENRCIFKGILEGKQADYYAASVEEYHEHIKPVEMVRYSVLEAIAQNAMSGHLGPWEEHIRALCNDDNPKVYKK